MKEKKNLTIRSRVSHMLLHETAKAREVRRHTRDAHHGALGCVRMGKGGAADPLSFPTFTWRRERALLPRGRLLLPAPHSIDPLSALITQVSFASIP